MYFLITPCFQVVNRLFVLSFEKSGGRTSYTRCYLPLVGIKYNNAMINEQNLFDKPVKDDLIAYDNIPKIATSQGDDYTTGCLLDYLYLKKS